MVKNLPLLRGARRSLFSEAGIAAPESRRSHCILYTLKPILVRSFPQRSGTRSQSIKSDLR